MGAPVGQARASLGHGALQRLKSRGKGYRAQELSRVGGFEAMKFETQWIKG